MEPRGAKCIISVMIIWEFFTLFQFSLRKVSLGTHHKNPISNDRDSGLAINDYIMCIIFIREAPTKKVPLLFGHCPFGGGGLDPCQDGLRHLFREELSKFKWAFA